MAMIYFGGLNVRAFKEIGAYCPSKMDFIILLEFILSSVALVYFLLSTCAIASDVRFLSNFRFL